MKRTPSKIEKALPWLLLLYGCSSLLHFAHNAEYLADYPNLPDWLTRTQVYVTWLGITAIGVIGYLLHRAGRGIGLPLVALYAVLGFDGLLHYGRAPFAAHSSMMNLTIWTEVVAAAVLLATVVAISLGEGGRRRG
jgi:hypothetical protein